MNNKIRMVRVSKNWSQEDMAAKLNMSTNGYAKIERGETQMNIGRLEKIAAIFDMNVMQLMSFGDNNSEHDLVICRLQAELEKCQLTIAHQDELLRVQQRELTTLQNLVDALKANCCA